MVSWGDGHVFSLSLATRSVVVVCVLHRYGSANILWLAMTVMVPLANFSFALPFMPNQKPLTWEDGVGLAVIMAGLLTYRFWTKIYELIIEKYFSPAAGAVINDGLAIGNASPSMATPLRGTLKHTGKKKKGPA